MDPDIPRNCQRGDGVRKMSYIDRAHAKRARRKYQRKIGNKLSIYVCPFCHYYHLASAPKGDA